MDVISLTKKIGLYNSLKCIKNYFKHDLIIKNKISNVYYGFSDFINFHLSDKYKISEEESEKIMHEIWSNTKKQSDLEIFPLVSIIIINKNGLNHLKRLFNRNINYPNYEIIVWDNGSTDSSLSFLKKNKKNHNLRIIKNKENSSFSKANNEAVKLANGNYILFLNNDIEMENGFLNHLMKTMLSSKDIASVGAKLAYPNCSNSKENYKKSFKVQHAGINFKNQDYFIKPYNAGNGSDLKFDNEKNTEKPALTAAVLLVDKSKFLEVGGFHEEYDYGYEDVDLGLKFLEKGYKNIYCPEAFCFHYEFGTQEKNSKKETRSRRLNNIDVFNRRWRNKLHKKFLFDKLNSVKFLSETPLKICFAVSESSEYTEKGDFFTALELSRFLKDFGWETIFLDTKNWYNVPSDVDVLITMIDSYDLSKLNCDNKSLIKVAWSRNWFKRWVKNPSFRNYDIHLTTSYKAIDFIFEETGIVAYLFPIATNHIKFNPNVDEKLEFESDYCFTGNYWNYRRDIVNYLEPRYISYKFNLYGKNWYKFDKFKEYYKGFFDYSKMPEVYASTKIVINDANKVTKDFGSVNSRVFDALSSGKLVISNSILDNEFFNGKLPIYTSKEDLSNKIEYYLSNEEERTKLAKELRKIVLDNHTYEKRAKSLKKLLKNYITKTKISIKVPAPKWGEVKAWGDYHIAKGIKKELENKGIIVSLDILPDWDYEYDNNDTVLVLRGLSKYELRKHQFNIMWNISHPDLIELEEYNKYDHVFIASECLTKELSDKLDVPVETLLQCTDPEIFYPDFKKKYSYDLLFVGNSRKVHRKILKDLLPTNHDLAVFGKDWEPFLDNKYIKGEHIPNHRLREAYSSSKILLNDHWDDMREKGFISNRIFDGFASGAFIISDKINGEDMFNGNLITYENKNDLRRIINYYLENSKQRNLIVQNIRTEILNNHTFKNRAKKILEII